MRRSPPGTVNRVFSPASDSTAPRTLQKTCLARRFYLPSNDGQQAHPPVCSKFFQHAGSRVPSLAIPQGGRFRLWVARRPALARRAACRTPPDSRRVPAQRLQDRLDERMLEGGFVASKRGRVHTIWQYNPMSRRCNTPLPFNKKEVDT